MSKMHWQFINPHSGSYVQLAPKCVSRDVHMTKETLVVISVGQQNSPVHPVQCMLQCSHLIVSMPKSHVPKRSKLETHM